MSIAEDVTAQLKDAMRAKDQRRLSALRSMRTAFLNEMKKDGSDAISDEACEGLLRKLEKQRKESIEAFTKGDREEMAEAERAELAVIQQFLPSLADEAQTRVWVEAAIAESGADAPGAADTLEGSDVTGDEGALALAEDGAGLLLWEAEAPSSALQLTSLWEGSLRVEVSFDRPDGEWWVAGTEDFDGDGLLDVLWQSAAGELAVSAQADLVDTASLASLSLVGELSVDEGVVSTGDYDGDGRADLLVEDGATGARTVWLMNDAGDATVEELRGLDVAASSVAASDDFDGDGREDLLVRAADGSLAIRFMDGAVVVAGLDVSVGSAQEAMASGDVDGDGDDDLVTRDAATGAVGVLLMGARQAPVPWEHAIAAGPGWEVAGVGDFDGDGSDDVLWATETLSATETLWMIGFHGQDGSAPEWVPVDPAGDWMLVSFAL